ncbi:hypothetical protein EDB19DRAFT_1832215 [Suillus lakei]|nr:hypothetical protein EDB19DRAFT_1832215 [Suillus lakei]
MTNCYASMTKCCVVMMQHMGSGEWNERWHMVVGAECRHAGIMGYTQSVRRFPSMIKGLVICMVTWWFAISVIMEGDEDRMNKDAVFDVSVQCGMVWLMLRLSGRVVGEDGRALEGKEGKRMKWCIRNVMGNEDINKKMMFSLPNTFVDLGGPDHLWNEEFYQVHWLQAKALWD